VKNWVRMVDLNVIFPNLLVRKLTDCELVCHCYRIIVACNNEYARKWSLVLWDMILICSFVMDNIVRAEALIDPVITKLYVRIVNVAPCHAKHVYLMLSDSTLWDFNSIRHSSNHMLHLWSIVMVWLELVHMLLWANHCSLVCMHCITCL